MSWFPAKSWESKFLILKLWKPWNFPDPEALIWALGRKLWLDESFKWTFSSPIFYHKNSQNQKESSAFRFKRFRFWSSERLEKFWSFEPKRLLKILKFFQDLKICRFFCRCKTSSALVHVDLCHWPDRVQIILWIFLFSLTLSPSLSLTIILACCTMICICLSYPHDS